MAEEDIIVMRQKELNRLHVIQKVIERELKQVEAVDILGLSGRQVRRIVKRVREEGEKGIVHKLRGKKSKRAIAESLRNNIIRVYRKKYEDFGPTLASEKLLERDKLKVSDETLRKLLIRSGDWQKKRKRKKHRKWRPRKRHFGVMVQMDGSHHEWFEGRGSKSVLMGYIDDATSEVFARFYEYEGTMPAMESFKRYVKKYGIPGMLYLDKHPTYKSLKKPTVEEQLKNEKMLSQFERALKELGVEVKHAHSPQAKGRIERLFRTFQDRVIKEMRLAGVGTIEGGNKFLRGYLPKYNKRFKVDAAEKGDMHREVPECVDLERILCKKTVRTVRNDNTVANNKRLYQIEEYVGTKKKVVVEERTNGKIVIANSEKKLRYREIKERPERTVKKPAKQDKLKRKVAYKPEEDHPWKKWIERGYPQNPSYQQRKKKEAKKKEKLLLLVH
ncbi:MAG: ISNCY family transposase [Candidatus Omnitrophota bacterium]